MPDRQDGEAIRANPAPAAARPSGSVEALVDESRRENDPLARLDRFIDSLAGQLARLDADLRESGFGAYSLGLASQLHQHFVDALEATRRTASVRYPWEELRSLAARLDAEGLSGAASEISAGLIKRAVRHRLPPDLAARLTADNETRGARPGPRKAEAQPELTAERRIMPERTRRTGMAAPGLAVALVLAVGSIAVVQSFGGPGAVDAPPVARNLTALSATALDTPLKRVSAASGDPVSDQPIAAAEGRDGPAAAGRVPATDALATGGTPPAGSGAPPVPNPQFFALADPTPPPRTSGLASSPDAGTGNVAASRPVPATNAVDLLDTGQAARVQKRLADLGYFAALPDGVWGPRSRSALRAFKGLNGLPADEVLDVRTRTALFSDKALAQRAPDGPAAVTEVAQTFYAPPPGGELNPLNPRDAALIQARLAELGYYPATGEGVWGPASRQALRDFKSLSGLPANEVWDVATERRLRSPLAARADATVIGAWGRGTQPCVLPEARGREVLWINTSAVTNDYRSCRVGAVTRAGGDWVVIAYCGGPPTALRFSRSGDLLVDRDNGGAVYRRCSPRSGSVVATSRPPMTAINVGAEANRPIIWSGNDPPMQRDPGPAEGPTPPADIGGGLSDAGPAGGAVAGAMGSIVGALP